MCNSLRLGFGSENGMCSDVCRPGCCCSQVMMPGRLNTLSYRISRSAKIGLVHFPQPFVLWKVELRQLLHDDRRWHQLLQGI